MMNIEGIETDNAESFLEGFEPFGYGQTTIWCGRQVQMFPWDRRYSSAGLHKDPWRYKPCYNAFSNVEQKCKNCNSDLVDFFWGYAWDYLVIEKIGLIFFRTCGNCCFDDDSKGKIFGTKASWAEGGIWFHNWIHESYIIPIDKSLGFLSDYIKRPNTDQKTFFQRLQVFLDNFDAGLADINDAIVAGIFRSFGVIRDSVDFFIAVGDYLKEKLGIDKEQEKKLYGEASKLSEETQEALRNVVRVNPLDIFRRIFPTGREVQEACFAALGIQYESDTTIKRIFEEFGAAVPFGPLWMAISCGGQVAVESGFISENEKLFYEITLALLVHKAIRLNENIPTALEVKKMSQSLIESDIDLSKIKAGNFTEINKANSEISSFLDVRESQPFGDVVVSIEEPKIPMTLVSDTCGWKVGDPISNRTLLGDVPQWNTVRNRYWKNKALAHKEGKVEGVQIYELSEENLRRVERGLAPQIRNPKTGEMESIELHHEPPQKEGGMFNFIEVTPQEHAAIDPHRYLGDD